MSSAPASTAAPSTGGCQCGAVRFRVSAPLGRASICHCRMCQKAFGSFFAPLVSARKAALTWSRDEPGWFQSSNLVRRGFCRACGTPLAYDYGGEDMELAIGAFDQPEAIAPVQEAGLAGFFARIVSHQHPDAED